jgi:type IV pilus modification protein PilV
MRAFVFLRPLNTLQAGTTLLEVLVSLLILSIGLLGLAGLQSRLQISEMESYQRAQALILMNDMANRISANRHAADSYITPAPLGVGIDCPSAGTLRQSIDAHEWCNALQGAAEVSGNTRLGAMLGGRGCIEYIGNYQYMITVAWQGIAPVSAPPDSVSCGRDAYDDSPSCNNDLCRRAVTTIVRVGIPKQTAEGS